MKVERGADKSTGDREMPTTLDKAVQLFTYLKELSKLRTTHTKDVAKYDEVLWFSDIPEERNCQCVAWKLWGQRGDEKEERVDVWVEVHKPTLKSLSRARNVRYVSIFFSPSVRSSRDFMLK